MPSLGPVLAGLLLAAEGRPLFYWGARPPVVAVETRGEAPVEARVTEVHAAADGGELVLRLTFDRRVRDALYLADGRPVSGRLRAVLHLDSDGDRSTGLDAGAGDLRTGADGRIEVGVVSVTPDPEEKDPTEKVEPVAVVTATLYALKPDGRRRTLWRGDHQATPGRVSVRAEYVELRLPSEHSTTAPGARLILSGDGSVHDGRVR